MTYTVTDQHGQPVPNAVVIIPGNVESIREALTRLAEIEHERDPQLAGELAYVSRVVLVRHTKKGVRG